MELLSIGGTSMVERCARARMRPLASSEGTSSMPETGVAPDKSCASASSTESSPLFIQLQVRDEEGGDRGIVVEIEHWESGLDLAVARHGHDVRIVRVQQRLARGGAPDLELRDRRELEAFDDQEIAGRDSLHLLFERGFVRAAQLVHQYPAPRG